MKRACTLEKAGTESSRRMQVSQPKERVLARWGTVAPLKKLRHAQMPTLKTV